jgi:hypothetical protein
MFYRFAKMIDGWWLRYLDTSSKGLENVGGLLFDFVVGPLILLFTTSLLAVLAVLFSPFYLIGLLWKD